MSGPDSDGVPLEVGGETPPFHGTPQGGSQAHAPSLLTVPPVVPDHQLLRPIGSGSYGEVWLARNIMGSYRAVKVVHRRAFEHQRPFDREFQGIQNFEPISHRHESQVNILHVGRNDGAGYFYYVMELADPVQLPGSDEPRTIDPTDYTPRTLKHELNDRKALSLEECLTIGLALTTALDHLHQHQLVHRDIKPSNIIFVHGLPKLADIGLVASMDGSLSMVGTAGYIAPEGPGTPAADIYSLGKVFYEMSMGRDRHEFPKLRAGVADEPTPSGLIEFNAVLLKACENEPGRRYKSAREMHADLLLLQSGKSVKRMRVLEKRLVRAKRFGLALGLLTVLAGGAVYQARKTTEVAQARMAQSLVEAGTTLMMAGDLFGSLPYHTEALRIDHHDPARDRAHRIRISSILSQLPKPIVVRTPQEKPIRQARFSPDGSQWLSHERWYAVRIWDVKTEALLCELRHTSPVLDASFSPDGRSILSVTLDQKAHVWDVQTRREKFAPLPHFHDTGTGGYALFFDAKTIYLFRNATALVKEPHLVEHQFTNLTLSLRLRAKRESVVITGQAIDRTSGKSLVTRSATDSPGLEVSKTYAGRTGFLTLCVWAHPEVSQQTESTVWFDDARVTLGAGRPQLIDDFNDGDLTDWWRLVTPNGRFEESEGMLKVTRFVEEMFAGRWALTMAAKTSMPIELREGQTIELQVDVNYCDDPTARVDLWWSAMPRGELTGLTASTPKFVANGEFVLTQVNTTDLVVWNGRTGTLVAELPHESKVERVVTHPETGTLLVLTESGDLWRWDLSVGLEDPVSELIEAGDFVEDVVLDPTGTHFLLFLRDSVPQVWESGIGPLVHRLDLAEGTEFAVFNAKGNRLAVLDRNNLIWVWNIEQESRLGLPIMSEVTVTGIEFSPDGKHLAIRTLDGRVRMLDIETHTAFIPAIRNAHPHVPFSFSADGSLLMIVHQDGAARIWDLTKIEARPVHLRAKLQMEPADLTTTISQDGSLKASIVDELSVEVWDSEGRQRRFHRQLQQPVKTCYFTDDNRYLITETRDRRAQIWDLASGEPLTPSLPCTYVMDSAYPLTNILLQDERRIEDLQRIVQVFTGTEFRASSESIPLTHEKMAELWSQTRTDYPSEFTPSQERAVRWHHDRAEASEHDWDWERAIFHLGHLQRRVPAGPDLMERRAYAESALGTVRPPRPPWSDATMVDLSEFYTDSLRNHSGFARLPTKVNVGNTTFETRGFIRLPGDKKEAALGKALNKRIPIDRRCVRFHFLHATEEALALSSTAVTYLIHYTDGSPDAPLVAKPGQDIYCWKYNMRYAPPSTNADLAWVGWNAKTGCSRLDRRTWENPHPEKVVESIELVSGMAGGSPLVFAITVE